jgi:hypothetical protein
MKKLLIICGVGLIIYCIAIPAFPLSYEIDVGQDGVFDTGSTICIDPHEIVTLDIRIGNYSCAPDGRFYNIVTYVTLDESVVQVNSCDYSTMMDPAYSECSQTAVNVYRLNVVPYFYCVT